MTTGEKLSKLRKENNYTQEALAEKIGVSRQAISKWESDGAFPETDKLIMLAKLYNCSIDYLLRNENNVRVNENEVKQVPISFKAEANQSLKKYLSINLATCIFSVISFAIMLLIFLLPICELELTYVNEDNFFNSIYGNGANTPIVSFETIDVNMFNIIAANDYQIGNFIAL